jgi:hypothetical protein
MQVVEHGCTQAHTYMTRSCQSSKGHLASEDSF